MVDTPPAPENPDPAPEIDTYFCESCKSPVLKGDAKCPVCELPLMWEGIGK